MPRATHDANRDDPAEYEDREFVGLDAEDLAAGRGPVLAGARFLACTFRACNVPEADWRGAELTECTFEDCELPLNGLREVLLHGVTFRSCRLTGVDFGVVRRDALGPEVAFEGCDLSLAFFRDLDLRTSAVRDCKALDTEWMECDLRGVDLTGTDFSGATFHHTDLRDADLRRSTNYVISPHENQVRGLQVGMPGAIGLLVALGVRFHP